MVSKSAANATNMYAFYDLYGQVLPGLATCHLQCKLSLKHCLHEKK